MDKESSQRAWIAVDLDGTLAQYTEWNGEDHIGDPIPLMVNRVKRWLREGKKVKIFTARLAASSQPDRVVSLIQSWCRKHIGQSLPVTNVKDQFCEAIWDDRAYRVTKNTGRQPLAKFAEDEAAIIKDAGDWHPGDADLRNLYPEAGLKAQPGVQKEIEKFRQLSAVERANAGPLLYYLLGDGTPAYKMSKDDAQYSHATGNETCANCRFFYQALGHGKEHFICSQVRGEVYADDWCNLWKEAETFDEDLEKDSQAKPVDVMTREDMRENTYDAIPPGSVNVNNGGIDFVYDNPAGLIDHLPEGTTYDAYDDRTVYTVPGYDVPINVYSSPDIAEIYRRLGNRSQALMSGMQYPKIAARAKALEQTGMSKADAWSKAFGLDGDPHQSMIDTAKTLREHALKERDMAKESQAEDEEEPPLTVITKVPKANLDSILKHGILSRKAMLDNEEVLNRYLEQRKADMPEENWDPEYEKDLVLKAIEAGTGSGYLGPSVLFTEPDPDKVSDPQHFINRFDTQTVKINLGQLLKDLPDTEIHGAELLPWPSDTPEEPEGRQRKLTPEEVRAYAAMDPSELWKEYYHGGEEGDEPYKYYAANVPHAMIITPSGVIDPKYLSVDEPEEEKEAQSEDEDEKKKKVNMKKVLGLLAGLAAAGAAGYGAHKYLTSTVPGEDNESTNLDYWRSKFHLWNADRRLATRDPAKADVEMETGLHRVILPEDQLAKDLLDELGYKPSVVAIPERGQEQLVSYRHPKSNIHIHKHPGQWSIHKDRHTPISMSLTDPDLTIGEKLKKIPEGVAHLITEGIPGGLNMLAQGIVGAPSIPDLQKQSSKKMVDMVISNDQEKTAELSVEVAETELDEYIGLGRRESIPDNFGMLFKRAKAFCMRDCNFDLDIVFMDKWGNVKDVQHMTKLEPGEPETVYTSKEAFDLALEVPSGWCKKHNVKPGSVLSVKTTQGDSDE